MQTSELLHTYHVDSNTWDEMYKDSSIREQYKGVVEFMQQLMDKRPVTQMNLEQFSANGIAQFGDIAVRLQLHLLKKNLSRQRVTIGVQAVGCQANDEVSWQNRFAIEHPGFLDDADNGAAEIVFSGRIESRHLGSLPADERATVFRAGFGKTFDNLAEDSRFEFSRPYVIQEEEWFSTEHGNIIDTMIDQVLTDGVVPIHGKSDLQFGPDAIDAGDEHWLPVLPAIEGEQTAKAADLPQDLGTPGRGEQSGQSGFDGVAQINIDSRAGVGFPFHEKIRSTCNYRCTLGRRILCGVNFQPFESFTSLFEDFFELG